MLRLLSGMALYTAVEQTADWLLGWIPLYAVAKLSFLLWFSLPQTNGANIMYRQFVHPYFARYERQIDAYIAETEDRAKAALIQAHSEVLRHGKRLLGEIASTVRTLLILPLS